MRFSIALIGLIAVPFTSAMAVPREVRDIAARSPNELDARLLGEVLGAVTDLWDNSHCGQWKIDDCSKKGQKCNNQCECDTPKPQCDPWQKQQCGTQQGTWDDNNCKCTPKPKPQCDPWQKQQCGTQQGTWDDNNCKCTPKPKPQCDPWQKQQCGTQQGTWDDNNCKCTPKPKPQCDPWQKQQCGTQQGSWDDNNCKCTPKPKPQQPQCPEDKKSKCSAKGGSCNDQCKCMKDGKVIDIEIGWDGINVGIL